MHLISSRSKPAGQAKCWLASVFLLTLGSALLVVPAQPSAAKHAGDGRACVQPGKWKSPIDGSEIKAGKLLDDMARRPIVLLGEAHTSAEHHRWQLQTLAALHNRNPNMVIGFEAFPRAVQPVLDRWTRGELSQKDFIELSRWNDVWRYNPALYMPLFNFARMNRIPIRALNVERSLIRAIRENGWASISADQRAGLGDPRPPSKAYRQSLEKVFGLHETDNKDKQGDNKPEPVDQLKLSRFIQVQTTWDRAMAEALAAVRTGGGDPLVVAIVGRGHAEYGFGIPHQLADLGIDDAAVLLPWDKDLACATLKNNDTLAIADAVFGVDQPATVASPTKPKLGVQIKAAENGIKVVRVVDGSVAASAGLKIDDIIIHAAGVKVTKTRQLVATIQAVSPGTWLPLGILRGDQMLDVIAKFPGQRDHPKRP